MKSALTTTILMFVDLRVVGQFLPENSSQHCYIHYRMASASTLSVSSSSSSSSPSSPSPSSYLETRLPFEVLEELVGFLHFVERRRLLGLSKTLYKMRPRLDSKTRTLVFSHKEGRRLILDQPFQSATRINHIFGVELSTALVSLTLDECANDGFLQVALVELELFPNMQSLRLRSCDMVSDFGLDCISRSVAAVDALQVVDITFCHQTTYGGTFCLRDRVNNLKILRRQPEWLDGRFETPFGAASASASANGGHSSGGEIHTYYCDGAFQFNRDSQSNGFVTVLFPWDDDFLGDKLQYNNFRTPLGKDEKAMKEALLHLRPQFSERCNNSSCPGMHYFRLARLDILLLSPRSMFIAFTAHRR